MDFGQNICQSLKKAGVSNPVLEFPPDQEMGDYAFPCFSLAKDFKKAPPIIAKELVGKLGKIQGVKSIKATGPYVNFFIDETILAKDTLGKIQKEKNRYGSIKYSDQKVMVEFSQANTHKAFHIGHIRGTSLGESLARIMESCGDSVVRANYQGDTGMHVAKWIWCYTKYHKDEKPKKDESWIAGIYVEAVRKLAENPDLQEEVDEINRKLDEGKDKTLNELWQETRKDSLAAFEVIYKDLNTHFDEYFFESQLEKRGKEVAKELVDMKIAEVDDGATIINLEKYDMGVWVLLRADGTALYSTKDLALAEKKFKDHKIEKAIYVVGSSQTLHLQQLFKTLELMKFKQAKNCYHVPVTEVRLPTGKMSSRTGENILYSDFKKELVENAKEEIRKRYEDLSVKELEHRSLAVAIAALKYSMLKQDTYKPIIFNKEEAMRFEGDTGPYLLYAYARSRSILEKAKFDMKKKYTVTNLTKEEKVLIAHMTRLPDAVMQAYKNLAPGTIANYANELAQAFNEFYHTCPVIGSKEEQFRLVLVESFSQVLKNALNLLGIDVIEKM